MRRPLGESKSLVPNCTTQLLVRKDKRENEPLPSTTDQISSVASFQPNKEVGKVFTSSTSFSNDTKEATDNEKSPNTGDNEHNSVLTDKTTSDTFSNLNKDHILVAHINEWRLLLLERPPSTQENELYHWLLKVFYFVFPSNNDDFQKDANTIQDDVQQVHSEFLSLHSSSNNFPTNKTSTKRPRKGKANASTKEKCADCTSRKKFKSSLQAKHC